MIILFAYSYRKQTNFIRKRIEKALEIIDRHIIEGLVYATYEDGLILKDLIWAYNARH